ncbi:type III-B CRISPR module RAMP protein Cmr4 [Bacteroidia bacterium]|nr:type III-B CRISPR module RAMP protein Cmr4 [Bacteroidia bacterium]GHV22591.1 type III-B CRISPR module RAMP protein Cmr4 [Bacteroidia bacterium]
MNTQVYLIKPFTNMHVGSGKENTGIVDNTVQRDVLTNFPVINSTSLKGALREYAEKGMKCPDADIEYVFGKGNRKKDGKEVDENKNIPGNFIFYSAHLLSIPARSDKFAFVHATCPQIIGDFLKQTELIGDVIEDKVKDAFTELLSIPFDSEDKKAICFDTKLEGTIVEFYNVKTSFNGKISDENLSILKSWLGGDFVWLDNNTFKKNIVGKLPIIARNHLENGQSTNLWYEEIIPRETIFYTFISAPEGKLNKLELNKVVLQIGANASVGYGFSEIYIPIK